MYFLLMSLNEDVFLCIVRNRHPVYNETPIIRLQKKKPRGRGETYVIHLLLIIRAKFSHEEKQRYNTKNKNNHEFI